MIDEKGWDAATLAAWRFIESKAQARLAAEAAITAYLAAVSAAPEGWVKIAERMTKWRADVEEAKGADLGYVGKSEWIDRLFRDAQYDVFRLVNEMTAPPRPETKP